MKSLKQIHIPTLVALLILAVGLGVTMFLVQQKQRLRTKAAITNLPLNLKISNQTAFTGGKAEAAISWQTQDPASGFILYGLSPDDLSFFASDVRDKNKPDEGVYTTHYVELVNLPPNQTIYYTIGVNNLGVGQCQDTKEFCTESSQCGGSECLPISFKTPPALENKPAVLAQGQAVKADNQPLSGGLIFINAPGSNLLSALTDEKGSWAINLALMRQADLSSYFELDSQASRVNISLIYGSKQSQGECITAKLDPAPLIKLGQPINCQDGVGSSNALPDNQLSQPSPTSAPITDSGTQSADQAQEADNKESGFTIPEDPIKILTPSREGEKVATQTPIFKGIGPGGKTLKIKVHSDQEITSEVYVDENGQWQWTPPTGLEPGEHTISLTYIDDNGQEHTVSRRFFVAANGTASEIPNYSASASAQLETSPTPSPTPTPSPSPTPIPRTSMPATDSGTPKAGFETFYLIAGVGLFFLTFGLFIIYTQSRQRAYYDG